MGTIINFTELLKQETITKSQGEYLSIIESSAQSGVHLISDLLDVHSFEYADSNLNMEEVDIRDYISDCAKNFEQDLFKKNQQLLLHIQIINTTFKTDHFLLSRILNNLISNAIKFSEINKSIQLTVEEKEASTNFKVKDEGPGISESDQKKMFKLFQKLSARPTNGESSNGLGLSIIKKLTEKLNGNIIVNSKLGKELNLLSNYLKSKVL